jgi:hypothetical protein
MKGRMEPLNCETEHPRQQQQIQWRRDKVQELSSKGHSQREIASFLQIGIGTVNRDIAHLRQQARENIKRYIDERLPEEYEKCLVGLSSILREAWSVSQVTASRIEKIKALTLAKECYAMKLELLTNATVVDDSIRFVASHTAVQKLTEKANSGERVTVDEEVSNSDDIQGSEKNRSNKQQSTTGTTNNSVF